MAARFERYRDANGKLRWRSFTRINDYLTGNVVPVRKVALKHRRIYRRTLLAAARAARDAGVKFHINSSYRSYAEQAELYAAYMNGHGNLAARPGTSRHEKGNALDINGNPRNVPFIRHALERRGFVFAVASEAWHVEYHG